MSVARILQEAQRLSLEERRELIRLLHDSIQDRSEPHSILELAGMGAEIWQGIDAQDYLNRLRSEWDAPR